MPRSAELTSHTATVKVNVFSFSATMSLNPSVIFSICFVFSFNESWCVRYNARDQHLETRLNHKDPRKSDCDKRRSTLSA
jgi:hypothetical protein